MVIAEMMPQDYEAVAELWRRTEGVGLNESDTRERITAFLARNPGLSLVARKEHRIIAAVLCGEDGRRGYLHHLAVLPEFRNRGLGTQLVDECLRRLVPRGVLKCNIYLYTDNASGERFWKNRGWRERSELKVLTIETPSPGSGS